MKTYVYTQAFIFDQAVWLLASDAGIMSISSNEATESDFFQYIYKRFAIQKNNCSKNESAFSNVIHEIRRFESGEVIHPTKLTFDLKGTVFQQNVWKALLEIPYGKTVSYGDIAEQINNKKAVRAVGGAIGANPILLFIPCHRVIGKDGSLTGFSSGLTLKKHWLQIEKSWPN